MSVFSRLAAIWRSRFSKSAAERTLQHAVKSIRPCRILEIGLGDGERARRVIALAQRYQPRHTVYFTGIDLFEERRSEPPLSLKDAYRHLRSTGARVRLVPGDPYGALVRAANSIDRIDLVLISTASNPSSLSAAWFFLPRTLSKNALVLWADGTLPDGDYRQIPHAELLMSARLPRKMRRRAA